MLVVSEPNGVDWVWMLVLSEVSLSTLFPTPAFGHRTPRRPEIMGKPDCSAVAGSAPGSGSQRFVIPWVRSSGSAGHLLRELCLATSSSGAL